MQTACYLNFNQIYTFVSPLTSLCQNIKTYIKSPKKYRNSFENVNNFFNLNQKLCHQDIHLLKILVNSVLPFYENNSVLTAEKIINAAFFYNHRKQYYLPRKPLYSDLLSCDNFPYYEQTRGFKTRNAKVGFSKEFTNLFKIKKKDDTDNILKTLLNDSKLSGQERDKLKISFAEGYVAGELKSKVSTNKISWIAGVRELIIFVIIIAMLYSVLSGPIKQLVMGNGNEVQPESINVSFNDVKGIENMDELQDIVDYLKNPLKYSALGGKLPKGVLLVGPPGTGKTLLARAVAGEAHVPFFHAVGSEFDEVLVGQGARRVRNLFAAAKEKAPCVIFIDEIDSVGSKRSKSEWHPYANQTVNQLLAEMDGFHKNEGIIVLGATNRQEDLDRALIRPGRFDIQISIPKPDLKGRTEIFKYYLGKIKFARDVDAVQLAKGTIGYTGADIENLVNQAALNAARDSKKTVNMQYFEKARDKILMGPEKKSRVPDRESNEITAYHEAGHTLVSYYTKDTLPLHKVTIIPHGSSLGHTASLPDKEIYYQTKSQILASLDTSLGGRAAEELIFGLDKITSGAADDLKKATEISTHLVKTLGMSEKVGLRVMNEDANSFIAVNDLGPTLTETIDSEINRLLNESYERAKNILKIHTKEHHSLARALLKYETLNANDIKNVIEGRLPLR